MTNSTYEASCTKEQNCYFAYKDSSLCFECDKNYYLDFKDGKCKSNTEDNEFKYCKISNLGLTCNVCINGYFYGEDLKCTNTYKCKESNNGICEMWSDNFYLGLDNKCSLIEHCIYSFNEKYL